MELILTKSHTTLTTLKYYFIQAVKALIKARQISVERRIAAMHLHGMTDRELRDIGITRNDIKRAVNNKL